MASTFQPNFNIENPYAGMDDAYAKLVAQVYKPTVDLPLSPVQQAAIDGQIPDVYYYKYYGGAKDPSKDVNILLGPLLQWLDDFYIKVYQWFHDVVDWIKDKIKPLFDIVWDWIKTEVGKVWGWVKDEVGKVYDWVQASGDWIVTNVTAAINATWGWITSEVGKVWDWIKTSAENLWVNIHAGLQTLGDNLHALIQTVADKVGQINNWFSNEFIDPFIDWLVQMPGKLWEAFDARITSIGRRLETWLTHRSPGFIQVISSWWDSFWEWARTRNAGLQQWLADNFMFKAGDPWALVALAMGALGGAFANSLTIIGEGSAGFWRWILTVLPRIGGWFTSIFSSIGGWLVSAGAVLGNIGAVALRGIARWLVSNWVPLLGSSAILGLEATGQLEKMIDKYVTPAVEGVMKWAEDLGPVSPETGPQMITGVTKLVSFTASGLAAMTLAGESLSLFKHIGLGHIAAMLYDVINYKTLTAAFMGVLAFVYIKTPLTYYYNKVARPNIPDERGLKELLGDYAITQDEFIEWMAFQGYTDEWSAKMVDTAFRPLTPFLLRSLAEAGLLPEDVLDRELHHAGYREEVIPIIKQMMINLAAGTLAAVSSSTAMTRYQEGFDSELTLRENLTLLGIPPQMISRYVFAAQLKYTYDYQLDMKNFYIDEYHRRVIEEPELRTSLVQAGLSFERLDLVVNAQKIKRLAVPKVADPPELTVQLDTIRDKRAKNLITRDVEVKQLVEIGKELPYALAIADNDDVKLTTKVPTAPPPPVPAYETEAGKVMVDTIRRLRRQGQSTPEGEFQALEGAEMPPDLAQAIVDNDALRMKKAASGE